MINKFKKIRKNSGALLLELLIVVSLLAVILSVGANAVFLSTKSNKVSGERDVASSLASESLEAVRSITEENWQNVYTLTKSTQHYHPVQSSGKWTLVTGDETINLNNASYTRYLVIDNVSRDSSTRLIENSYVSADDDPSTQKVTATVSWSGGAPVVVSQYFFRWKNKICAQAGWTTGATGNTVEVCPGATYDVKDPSVNTSSGSIQLQ